MHLKIIEKKNKINKMLSEVIESVCKKMPFTRLKLDRFSSFFVVFRRFRRIF